MIAYFARHPTAANLLVLAIVVLGIMGAMTLTRETFPDFDAGFVHVQVVYKGASAEEVEETICQRIEDEIEGIEGIKQVESIASEGMGFLKIEIVDGFDANEVLTDVENEIDQIDNFPDDSEEPLIWELEQEDMVIMVGLSADMPEKDLYSLADSVKGEMLALDGVTQVNLKGFSEHQIRVEVRREALLAHGVTIGDIAREIQAQSLDLPAGSLETSEREIKIRVVDQRRWAEDFQDLPVISSASGARIPLGTLATVTDTFEEDWNKATLNGKSAAVLEVTKSDEGDAIRISRTIREYLDGRNRTLPKGVALTPMFDISSIVSDRLTTLTDNAILGFFLVFGVLWLFLNIRLSFWVAFGIPVSFLGTLWVLGIADLSINMITMVSLILALGLIVDDAIVIGENIYEHRVRGSKSITAAIEGTREVTPGVVSSMLTTVAVFMPLMTMKGEFGKVLRVMPLGVIAALAVSILEGFLVLPNHLAHSMKNPKEPNRFRVWMDNAVQGFVKNVYGPVLDWCLNHRLVPVTAAIMLFLSMLGLLAGGRIDFRPFPDLDGDILVARVLMPQGTDLDRTEAVTDRIESGLGPVNAHFKPLQPEQQDLVRYYSTTFGFNSEADETGSHVATVMVELLSADERDARCDDILELWRETVGEIPDAVSIIYDQMEIGPGGKPIDVQLVGDNLDELKKASLDLQEKIRTYPGVKNLMDDLRPGKNEIHVRLKPTGRSLGVTSQELARQVRGAFWHEMAEEFQRGEDTFDVDVRLDPADRESISDLEDFKVVLPDGAQIPFEEVAQAEESRGFSKIVRVDGHRTASITGDVDSREGNAAKIMADLKENYFPVFLAERPGISINLEGEQKETATTMRSVVQGLVIGLVIIFILLSFVFESYVDPFIVMATIPFGLIGAIAGHLVMGKDWTMPSTVGFVSLAGIVVNDSIVLVTFIKARIQSGVDPFEAILRAGKRRFRPVFLTTATTVAGLTPLLLETSLQAQILIPLTISIAFGLTFATLLTLVLIPCLYSLMTDFKRLWRREKS